MSDSAKEHFIVGILFLLLAFTSFGNAITFTILTCESAPLNTQPPIFLLFLTTIIAIISSIKNFIEVGKSTSK